MSKQIESRRLRTLTRANAICRPTVEYPQQASNEGNSSRDDTTAPAFCEFHPVLRPMRECVERVFERDDYERGFPLLRALAELNGRRSFWQPAAHEHFQHKERQVEDARD